MAYLQGEQVEIKTSVLRKLIGVRVEVLKKSDITPRGIMKYRTNGTIDEVINKNVSICGDWIHLSEIKEIVKL